MGRANNSKWNKYLRNNGAGSRPLEQLSFPSQGGRVGARVPQPQQRYSRPLQRRGCRVRWSRGRSPPPAGLYRRRRPGRFPPSRRTASNPDNGKTQRRRELETHFTRSVLLSMWYNIENHRSLLFLSSLPRFNRNTGGRGWKLRGQNKKETSERTCLWWCLHH